MEKFQNILKTILLVVSVGVLCTIQFQLIDDKGININVYGNIDTKSRVYGALEIEGDINSDVSLDSFSELGVELSGGINTYEQN
jgi:hypothetical protein